jgi:hypothetical protein
MHEYRGEIRSCNSEDEDISIRDGDIVLNWNQTYFEETVQFELRNPAEKVDAQFVVSIKDVEGKTIGNLENQFTLSIYGDQSASTVDCSGATSTLETKGSATSYMNFEEFDGSVSLFGGFHADRVL